jgi:hypothetical protein
MTFRAAQSFGAVGRATLRAEPSGNARCPAERPRTAASYPGIFFISTMGVRHHTGYRDQAAARSDRRRRARWPFTVGGFSVNFRSNCKHARIGFLARQEFRGGRHAPTREREFAHVTRRVAHDRSRVVRKDARIERQIARRIPHRARENDESSDGAAVRVGGALLAFTTSGHQSELFGNDKRIT